MSETIIKVLKPSIDGRVCYCRVPIARKIMGTGAKDSEILINAGIPAEMADIALNLETGTYSLDNTLAKNEGYCGSFSTTRLLQLLPVSFSRDGAKFGIILTPGKFDGFGRSNLVGMVVNIETETVVEEFRGHPVSVLVKLIEYTMRK